MFRLTVGKTCRGREGKRLRIYYMTLSISPHKDAGIINRLGERIAAAYGIKFYEADFKKKDGFKISCSKARAHGMYRQGYCGCIYSKK
ncbi:MAG: epoxyqueuosine reductase QueH [Candidatus Omnitrophica bacterium]|nr:epoxyqueuosine reductase QueH [Candidatus Omnitrophota bacterium]